jgi:hypothetical protein
MHILIRLAEVNDVILSVDVDRLYLYLRVDNTDGNDHTCPHRSARDSSSK